MEFQLKNRKKLIEILLCVILPLIIGFAIYWLARPRSINIFSWLEATYLSDSIISPNSIKLRLPKWFIYNLPDFLWIFSFTSLLLITWDKKITQKNTFYLLIPCIFAISHEFGQLFLFVGGTFDKVDLLFYLLGYFSSLLLLIKTKKHKYHNEQNNTTSY